MVEHTAAQVFLEFLVHVLGKRTIFCLKSDGDTAATLRKHADSAMYGAKRGQLGFAFFDRNADL